MADPAAAEATCAFPEPTWGEEDMVFECSTLDVAELVSGAKVDARCEMTGVWFDSRVVAVDSVAETAETRVAARVFLFRRDAPGQAPAQVAARHRAQPSGDGNEERKTQAERRRHRRQRAGPAAPASRPRLEYVLHLLLPILPISSRLRKRGFEPERAS